MPLPVSRERSGDRQCQRYSAHRRCRAGQCGRLVYRERPLVSGVRREHLIWWTSQRKRLVMSSARHDCAFTVRGKCVRPVLASQSDASRPCIVTGTCQDARMSLAIAICQPTASSDPRANGAEVRRMLRLAVMPSQVGQSGDG